MDYAKFIFLLLFLVSCSSLEISKKDKIKSSYHLDIAMSFIRHNKNPEAIAELEKAIKLDPKNYEAYHQMGLCLYQRGRLHEAIDNFKTSIMVEPKATNVRNDLITLQLEQKNYVEAYRNAVISVNDLTYTQPAQSYFLKAQAAIHLMDKYPKFIKIAQNSLQSTLQFNPDHCGALFHLGEVYSKKRQYKKSYVLYNKSLKSCQLNEDKIKSLNALIPLSKKFGLVYQWGRYKQLQSEIAKKPVSKN